MSRLAGLRPVDFRICRNSEDNNRRNDKPRLAYAKCMAAKESERLEQYDPNDAGVESRQHKREAVGKQPIGGIKTEAATQTGQQPKRQIKRPAKPPLQTVPIQHERRNNNCREKID